MIINLTEKEKFMLQSIAQNEMNRGNGDEVESAGDTQTWVNCLDCGRLLEGMESFPESSFGGIVASLSRKDLAYSDGEVIELSEKGFEVWKEIKSNW